MAIWEWRKNIEDGRVEGTFDFQPQLTTEPSAEEVNLSEFTFVKVVDSTTPPLFETDDGSIDGLAINPLDPNADGSRCLKYDFGGIEL
jgi:hypothetical protein